MNRGSRFTHYCINTNIADALWLTCTYACLAEAKGNITKENINEGAKPLLGGLLYLFFCIGWK